MGIIVFSLLVAGVLIKLGAGYIALGIPAVVIIAPVANGIAGFVLQKIRGEAEKKPEPQDQGSEK